MPSSDALKTEYEQVNENFRTLADIRFKLVALVPSVGGVAAYLLSRLAEKNPDHGLVLAISLLGFLTTLGITFYDLRNSQLYNALIERAKALEESLDLLEGQFGTRPKRTRRLLLAPVGHDPGLALIYAPVLGAWFYPLAVSVAALLGTAPDTARALGFLLAGAATVLFLEEFLRLDGVWKRLS